MRCGAEMARHLVEEVGCAKYTEAPAASAAAADVDAQPESAPKRTRKAK